MFLFFYKLYFLFFYQFFFKIHTIIDCDKVLVMKHGEVEEFEIPYVSLKKKNSPFYELVSQTGKQFTQNLIEQAKVAYQNKYGTLDTNIHDVNYLNNNMDIKFIDL